MIASGPEVKLMDSVLSLLSFSTTSFLPGMLFSDIEMFPPFVFYIVSFGESYEVFLVPWELVLAGESFEDKGLAV